MSWEDSEGYQRVLKALHFLPNSLYIFYRFLYFDIKSIFFGFHPQK